MKMLTTCTLVSALALIGAPSADAAIIADLGGDYIDGNTLPANYQFLESDAVNGGTEIALTGGKPLGTIGNIGFGGSFTYNLSGVLGSKDGNNEFEIFGDGSDNNPVEGVDLLLHPRNNLSRPYVIVRRTITAGDLVNGNQATIAGSFRNLVKGPSVDVFVYHNAGQLFSGTAANNPFDVNTTIGLGDTIDFILFSRGNWTTDETALRATIDVVPEPASLALLMLGGAALLGRRRRR